MTSDAPIGRRRVLKGLLATAGLACLPTSLSACGALSGPASSTRPAEAAVASSPVRPSGAPSAIDPAITPASQELTVATWMPEFHALGERFTQDTGIAIKSNTVIASDFGDNLLPYLDASPEDVINASAASTRRLAAKGLAMPIDDVWAMVGSRFPAAVRQASTAADGHQYFMPLTAYPWAVVYRPDVFATHGYEVPSTWADFISLAARMQADGLVPITLGDREVFEADGIFDILDLRLNGWRFHLDLLAGDERWTDARVRNVFERWREILPYIQPGAVARSGPEATQAIANGTAGMYVMGTGVLDSDLTGPDVDIFPFPRMGTAWDAEAAFDLTIDGFMITSRSPTRDPHLDAAKAFLEFVASRETQSQYAHMYDFTIPLATDADTDGDIAIQRSARAMLASASSVAEFLDRDASRSLGYKVGTAIQDFLEHPDQDLEAFLAALQAEAARDAGS